jgi:hypothetical protein
MDEILKRLREVCAQTCGESTDEWCETHRTCLECRTDLVDAIEKELDANWTRKEDVGTIGTVTVKVVPRIDWELVADEFAEFSETVRGLAGDRA